MPRVTLAKVRQGVALDLVDPKGCYVSSASPGGGPPCPSNEQTVPYVRGRSLSPEGDAPATPCLAPAAGTGFSL